MEQNISGETSQDLKLVINNINIEKINDENNYILNINNTNIKLKYDITNLIQFILESLKLTNIQDINITLKTKDDILLEYQLKKKDILDDYITRFVKFLSLIVSVLSCGNEIIYKDFFKNEGLIISLNNSILLNGKTSLTKKFSVMYEEGLYKVAIISYKGEDSITSTKNPAFYIIFSDVDSLSYFFYLNMLQYSKTNPNIVYAMLDKQTNTFILKPNTLKLKRSIVHITKIFRLLNVKN